MKTRLFVFFKPIVKSISFPDIPLFEKFNLDEKLAPAFVLPSIVIEVLVLAFLTCKL
jgi:hypothetical protein